MLARSINLDQKEIQIGLFLAEALLLVVALLVIVRAVTYNPPPIIREVPTQESQTVVISQNSEELLLNNAREKLKMGDIDGSINILTVAIEVANPPSADLYGTRALAYSRLDQYAEAVQDYREALAINPNNAMYHTGICFNSAQIDDYETATTGCNNAITLQSNNWIVWNDRCYLRAYYLGDSEGAINDCTQALILNPTHPYPFNNLARAYLLQGNYAQAITEATRSIEFGNRYPALPYTTRGTAYIATGNMAQAGVDYQTALAYDPTYPELHFRLAEWYRYQNQIENARQSYCRYIELERQPIQYAVDQAQVFGGCG